MENQVKITLKALTSNVSPAERVIFLNLERPSIPIGRASKSISKGLLSAPDNAWFDSPVMSRDHAEISINTDDKTITIQDIGSMHGTYLNDYELPRKTLKVINDGDIVVFGAEVRRGPETFPACKFKINYEFVQNKSANTFRFPDSSDFEEEEGDYDNLSEDGIDEQDATSSEDDASIESRPAKVSAPRNPIDLTGDISPLVFPSDSIDLTGESPSEQDLMDMMEGRPADIPHDAVPSNISIYAGAHPILVESEDEDAHFSMDSDDQSNVIDDDQSSENEIEDEAEDSEPSEDEDDVEDSEMEGAQEPSELGSEEPSPVNNIVRFALATHDNSTVLLSDIRTRIEEPMALMDDDDQSDFGLSEAGEAGIRALFEDGLLRHSHDASDLVSDEASNDVGVVHEPKHITVTSLASTHKNNSDSSAFPDYTPFQINQLKSFSDPIARQPSPSDAAMVKSRTPVQGSAQVGVCNLGAIGKPVEQTLGEKTGKSDFFEARAINKAKLNANNNPGSASGMGLTEPKIPIFAQSSRSQATTSMNPFAPRQNHTFGAAQSPKAPTTLQFNKPYCPSVGDQVSSSAVNKMSSADTIYFPIREQCSFLDNPAHGPTLDKAPSPEPYMTSAVNFNAATQKPRSGLGIKDIINNASTPTQSLKRKADMISDVTDAELGLWAQTPFSSNSEANAPANVTTSQPQSAAATSSTQLVPAKVDDAAAPRPAKKLKSFWENVGYAALGGVAVGAGLFSALVATAPDFL